MASERRGIRFYLAALNCIAVIPLVVIAGVLVVRQNEIQRQVFQHSLLETSLALSVAVDRQLSTYRVMLETLACVDELGREDWPALYRLAARVAAQHNALFISVFDRSGKQIFNTQGRSEFLVQVPLAR